MHKNKNISIIVKSIFEKNLNQKFPKVDKLKFGENKRWDSLKHIQIILNIETEFNIKIKTSDVGKLDSFTKIVDHIKKY